MIDIKTLFSLLILFYLNGQTMASQQIDHCSHSIKKILDRPENEHLFPDRTKTESDIKRLSMGAAFLHKRNPNLHLESPIDILSEDLRLSGIQNPQAPVKKIAAWLGILEQIHLEDNPNQLENITRFYHNKYVIKATEVPESYYEFQKRLARERGYGNIDIDRTEVAAILIADQKASLSNWISYLLSRDADHYPIWARLWALQGMAKLGKFNKETGQFPRRRMGTTAPFIELDREALAIVMELIVKKVERKNLDGIDEEYLTLLKEGNFGKLYARTLKETNSPEINLKQTDGVWIKYDQGSDHRPLLTSISGKNTGWCTVNEEQTKEHLRDGDFYVYYSKDVDGIAQNPRVAIRMEGNEIAEVRGIGKDQNLDSEIAHTNIVSNKMNHHRLKPMVFGSLTKLIYA